MNRAIERIRSIPNEPFAWYELCKALNPHSEGGLKEFALGNHLPVNGALHQGWLEYKRG